MSKKTDYKKLWRKEQDENIRLRNHIRVLATNAKAGQEIILLLLDGRLTVEQLKKDLADKLPLANITKTRDSNNEGGENDKSTNATNGN